jgi:hypothetical protein
MNTTLLVSTDGVTYERVDIFEDIPISLVIQQSDLTDLTGRRVPYSKTIQLPDTSQNSIVFENYFEVNGIDFNPLSRLQCVVQYRGTDIFTGVLRLNSVTQTKSSRVWEIYILGEVTDFTSEIRDYTLQELDWIGLQHANNYSSVTQSWEAKPNTTDGLLNGDVIYPLINYGLFYEGTSTTPNWSFDFVSGTSFSLSGNSVPPTYFKPAVRIKTILDKIFEKTKYSYQSDFFNTDYFNSIYMDTFTDGQVGVLGASAVTNQNLFRVYTNDINTPSPIFTQNNSIQYFPLNWRSEQPDGYDPLGNFELGTSGQIAPTNEGYFQAPYTGDYFFNIRFNYTNPNFVLGSSTFYIQGNKSTSLSNIQNFTFYSSPQLNTVAGVETEADLYFSANCQAGEYVKIFILLDGTSSTFGTQVKLTGYNFGGVTTVNPMWELYNSPTLIGQQIVDFSLGINNMNSLDFIKSLITMFNLVVIQDENQGVIRFEPYNWYYNDTDRPQKDWTQIVDTDSQLKIEPLSFELSKQLTWTNQEPDEDILNFNFYQQNNYVFGRYKFITPNNIFSGEQIYETPFGSVPTNSLQGAPNIIIPEFYYLNNGLQVPYQTPPHLFFWSGNRFMYKDTIKTIQGSWYMLSGSTPVRQTTYPCVSHLSSLDVQIPDLVSDLNFQGTFDFFGNSNNQPVQFTPYTLYNLYWEDYVENLYSPETRRLTCRVFLSPVDIYQTSLRDKIYIKDSYYTIEKINEADLVNKKLTEVMFIKDRVPYYRVEPPAPFYPISGNTPYPGLGLFTVVTCFVGSQTDVCNGSATIEPITVLGTVTGLNNLLKVYEDTGTTLSLLPMGTYLRDISSSDLYVVIDNYGRILQTSC